MKICRDARNALIAVMVLTQIAGVAACSPKASQVTPSSQPSGISIVDRIDVSAEGDARTLIAIRTTAPINGNYTVLKVSDPPTIIVEMPGVELGSFAEPVMPSGSVVSKIEGSAIDGGGVRFQIHLSIPVEHEVMSDGETLSVSFLSPKIEEKAEAEPPVEVKVEQIPAEEPKVLKPVVPSKPISVTDVMVRQAGKFTEAEIVTSGDPESYNVFSLKSPNRVVVDINNAREVAVKKTIKANTTHLSGVRLGRSDSRIRVVFDYKGALTPYNVVKENDRIRITFGKAPETALARIERPKTPLIAAAPPISAAAVEKAGVAEKPVQEKAEPLMPEEGVVEERPVGVETVQVSERAVSQDAENAMKEREATPEKPAVQERAGGIDLPVMEEVENGNGPKVYKGRKVTLEFKDADIKNIFRVIAEVSGFNMIIDPSVSGKLTLRLVNVPWDQALDIILETNNLGMKKVGNVIRVLPLATIKKEKEELLAAKKATEKLEDLVTKLIPVSYAKATDIQAQLKGVMTDRGTTTVDERTNIIIIKDIQKSVDDAVKLVKELDEPTAQVLIEARIVKANTTYERNLGIRWGADTTGSAATGNPTGLYFPNSYDVSLSGGGSVINAPSISGDPGGLASISFGSINDTINLDLRLQALETQGEGKVISSPKIITLDNKEASIQQGFSIPFETTSASGTQTTFIDANLNLTVTPHVTADGRISMKVKASKNAPSLEFKGASGAPSIDKKEATTEILVKDGETTVIGGIYEIDKAESETKVPWLADIPILGWLFKSKSVKETKTELLIFITPRIMRDMPPVS